MEIEVNFEKTCRTCAKNFNNDLYPIFTSKNLNIVKMLEIGFKGFNFKITKNDNLPKRFCNSCSKQLSQIYMFLLQCEKSERILIQRLQRNVESLSTKTEIIKNEINNIDIDYNVDNYDKVQNFSNFSNLLLDITSNEQQNFNLKKEYISYPNNVENNFKIESSLSEEENSTNYKDRNKFQKKLLPTRVRKKIVSIKDTDNKKTAKDFHESDDDSTNKIKANNLLPKREYICSSCFLKFDKFSNLRRHKKEKHPTEPMTYLCDVCGKEFNKKDRLQQHRNRHLGVKPFKCDTCGKTFTIKTSLRSHIKRHVNPENFSCEVCGKNFIIKKCYEEHVKRHDSGEKLFKCPYCPRKFKLLSTLTHHCTFHNKTLDKKYHCKECNTNFRRSDHLKEHINGVHLKILPFKCELCPHAFVTGAKRNIHVKRMHSGKRYQCNQCEKDFSLPSSLNRHKKSHNGVKSLICEICNESFVTPNQIERHMESHQLDEAAKNNLITQTYEKIKHIAVNQYEIIDNKVVSKS